MSAESQQDYEGFAARWFAPLVALLVRVVHDPALAYDLTTETIATARLRWEATPDGDERVGWLLGIGAKVLGAAVERGRVPSVERRRGRHVEPHRLTPEEQREIMRLAEAQVDLPPAAREGAAALARAAPPPHTLGALRLSGLVEAESLSDRTTERHGS